MAEGVGYGVGGGRDWVGSAGEDESVVERVGE